MKNRIRIDYRTGNSFGSEDTSDFLEGHWENLDVAKENLKRIREHYEWYQSIDGWSRDKSLPRPKWHKVQNEDSDYSKNHYINLVADNGKEYMCSCFWNGYFDQLYGAEIVSE
ncbi:MAG: hypothetical protein ACTSO5_15285 [Candidatus Heimdallarchaeaceae archaeon]